MTTRMHFAFLLLGLIVVGGVPTRDDFALCAQDAPTPAPAAKAPKSVPEPQPKSVVQISGLVYSGTAIQPNREVYIVSGDLVKKVSDAITVMKTSRSDFLSAKEQIDAAKSERDNAKAPVKAKDAQKAESDYATLVAGLQKKKKESSDKFESTYAGLIRDLRSAMIGSQTGKNIFLIKTNNAGAFSVTLPSPDVYGIVVAKPINRTRDKVMDYLCYVTEITSGTDKYVIRNDDFVWE